MISSISTLLAIILIFFSQKTPDKIQKNKLESDLQLSFPYQYYKRESLTEEESSYRMRLRLIYLLFGLEPFLPLFFESAKLIRLPFSQQTKL